VITPRVAIIGFGMAGVGASRAVRHHRGLANTPADFRPEITVLEACPKVGGKVAQRDVGAQFIDETGFYPIDRLIAEHRLETHPAREDYELVHMKLKNGTVLDAEDFSKALDVTRRELLAALTPARAAELDTIGVVQFIEKLRMSELLDDDEEAAMRARALLEEGKRDISSLYYALTFAKSATPMNRLEVVGGLYEIPNAERKALAKWGGRIVLDARVIDINVKKKNVRITWQQGDDTATEDFDAAIIALSPEHLSPKRLRITGSPLPLGPLIRLRPARITKSNLTLHRPVRATEHATERYAMWISNAKRSHELVATFFHGWEGQAPLSLWQMLRIAVGNPDPGRLIRFESETWDSHAENDGVPEAYITQPGAGEGRRIIALARDQYFRDTYSSSPVRVANHVLGIGGTVRDAAMAGERAFMSLLRGWGYDTSPGWRQFDDPEKAFFGAGADVLDTLE